jgi:hypothetical protein
MLKIGFKSKFQFRYEFIYENKVWTYVTHTKFSSWLQNLNFQFGYTLFRECPTALTCPVLCIRAEYPLQKYHQKVWEKKLIEKSRSCLFYLRLSLC